MPAPPESAAPAVPGALGAPGAPAAPAAPGAFASSATPAAIPARPVIAGAWRESRLESRPGSGPESSPDPRPERRRTFEDKTVRVLAQHAGKIYLGLFALTAVVVSLRNPTV